LTQKARPNFVTELFCDGNFMSSISINLWRDEVTKTINQYQQILRNFQFSRKKKLWQSNAIQLPTGVFLHLVGASHKSTHKTVFAPSRKIRSIKIHLKATG